MRVPGSYRGFPASFHAFRVIGYLSRKEGEITLRVAVPPLKLLDYLSKLRTDFISSLSYFTFSLESRTLSQYIS